MPRSFEDSLSADDKSIGFDYQDLYALLLLLRLRPGEQLGIEIKDDIHISHSNGCLTLIQTKHTVQLKADGSSANLTSLDIDLWKTLYNWSKIIVEASRDNHDTAGQIAFVKMTNFVLVTNKSLASNTFVQAIQDFRTDGNLDAAIFTLSQLRTTDIHISQYIKTVLSLKREILSYFFNKIRILTEEDELITRIYLEIKQKIVPDEHIKDAFDSLLSEFLTSKYTAIKSLKKVTFTFEEFYRFASPCFKKGRVSRLIRRDIDESLVDEESGIILNSQLLDLEIDEEDVLEYDSYRMITISNIKRWVHEGALTRLDVDLLYKTAKTKWRPVFRACESECKDTSADVVNSLAKSSFYNTMALDLHIDGQILEPDISNGAFLDLADEPSIGWHPDWKQRYGTK